MPQQKNFLKDLSPASSEKFSGLQRPGYFIGKKIPKITRLIAEKMNGTVRPAPKNHDPAPCPRPGFFIGRGFTLL